MCISNSPPEHLQMECQSTSLLITAVSCSCQPSPQINPLLPSSSGRMGRMGTPGCARLALCPPLLLQQTEGRASLQTIPLCRIQQEQGSASITPLTHRWWGEEIGQGDREKPSVLLPRLRGMWEGWDVPDLPAPHAAAPGDAIRGRASHRSNP